jgi:hypothetical protein
VEIIMTKSKSVVAVSLAFVSLAAFAGGPNEIPSWFSHPQSTLTRAQVTAELERARARGELVQDEGYRFKSESSSRSRKEVMAELREAQRLGLTGGGDGGVFGTPEQEAQIAKAGAAAREQHLASGATSKP